MHTNTLVLRDQIDQVAVIRLNRPERHNSLIPELLEALLDELEECAQDAGVGAIVLTHAGRSFSTGGDVFAFAEHKYDLREYSAHVVALLNETILMLVNLEKPTVAAVDGAVTGGALGLVLACDIALVTTNASFAPYYVDVGFSPDGGWTAMLPQVIGVARARDTQLRNATITAEQAVAWGMAARMVDAHRIQDEALHTAASVAGKMHGSVQRTRALLRPDLASLRAALAREKAMFLEQIVSDEARQGMQRFLSRNK